jgi:hypothetical protein
MQVASITGSLFRKLQGKLTACALLFPFANLSIKRGTCCWRVGMAKISRSKRRAQDFAKILASPKLMTTELIPNESDNGNQKLI